MKSYQELLRAVLSDGEPHADRTGVGTTSLFGASLKHDMRAGFPLVTTKRVPFRWVAEELRWFLQGRTDARFLQERGVDIWDEWATAEKCGEFGREAGDLGPVYGAMWRRFPVGAYVSEAGRAEFPPGLGTTSHVDQVALLLEQLEREPNSRRLIVTGWHPWWSRRVTLPPCHTLFQLKCHGSTEMSLRMYARSIDAFLGLPFDLASYALLLELLCARVGRKARWLAIDFGDLHLYDNHRAQAAELLSREPRMLPRLAVLTVLRDLTDFEVRLDGYDPWPKIEAEVAV